MKIQDFLNKERNRIWTPGTKHLKDSSRRIDRLIESVGNIELSQVTVDTIHDFFDELKEEGMTDATIDRYAASISSIMRHAKRTNRIAEKPDFVWNGSAKASNRIRSFSEDEVAKLLGFFKHSEAPWMHDMVQISLDTGMRHGEIVQLMKGVAKLVEDGGQYWIYLPTTKNGDERYIPARNRVLEAARRLFSGKYKYNHHIFYRLWSEARFRIARGDKNFVFHVCRHTAATRLANDLRINTTLIGKMLGHRSPVTTAKYIHGKADHLQDIAEKMTSE